MTLSMKRCEATSVSFTLISRPPEMILSLLSENAVLKTQSLCEPICTICLPVADSIARTVLSGHPTASSFPSGDHCFTP